MGPAKSVVRILWLHSCVVAATSLSAEDATSLLVTDYVEFFKHRHVYILDTVSGVQNTWVMQTYRHLGRVSLAYTSALPLARLEAVLNRTKTYLSQDSNVKVSSPLLVFRMETLEDVTVFREVFPRVFEWFSWLLLLPETDHFQWLDQVYLPINSKVTVAIYSEAETTGWLWQVYQVSPSLRMKTLPSGTWQPRTLRPNQVSGSPDIEEGDEVRNLTFGTLVAVRGDPLQRRTDLTGLHLNCTTIQAPPHTWLREKEDGTVSVEGMFADILFALQEIANFTYSCRMVRDNRWGSMVEGRWTGLVRDVVEGVADIAVASLDITHTRSTAVSFLLPLYHLQYSMVIKRPSNNDNVWATYTKGFHPLVWLMLAITIAVISACLYLTTAVVKEEENLNMLESLAIVTGALCGQGCYVNFVRFPSRLVFFTVMLLHVVIVAHYTSDLVSDLAAAPLMPAIYSFSDVRRKEYPMGTVRNTALTDDLKNSNISEHRLTYEHMTSANPGSMVRNTAEGVDKVLREKYIFVYADIFLMNNVDCRHYILQRTLLKAKCSFALKKNSPLVPIFNGIILKMKASGLLRKFERRWKPTPMDCDQVKTYAVKASTITTPILVLVAAAVLSVCCCSAENLVWWKVGKRRDYAIAKPEKHWIRSPRTVPEVSE